MASSDFWTDTKTDEERVPYPLLYGRERMFGVSRVEVGSPFSDCSVILAGPLTTSPLVLLLRDRTCLGAVSGAAFCILVTQFCPSAITPSPLTSPAALTWLGSTYTPSHPATLNYRMAIRACRREHRKTASCAVEQFLNHPYQLGKFLHDGLPQSFRVKVRVSPFMRVPSAYDGVPVYRERFLPHRRW